MNQTRRDARWRRRRIIYNNDGDDYIREVKDEVMFQCCFGLDFR